MMKHLDCDRSQKEKKRKYARDCIDKVCNLVRRRAVRVPITFIENKKIQSDMANLK